MKYFYYTLLIVFLFFAEFDSGYAATEKQDKNTSNEQISIDMNFLPNATKPGNKPFTITRDFLGKLLPEIKNPRLMSFADLEDIDEQDGFLEAGYSFVLTGDFNNDKFGDVVFVGKYDNQENSEATSFIAIVGIRPKKVIREYFSKLNTKKAYLVRIPEYKPHIEAIGIIYNPESEDCEYLFWIGKNYDFKPCRAAW